jgi:hypothetical protein
MVLWVIMAIGIADAQTLSSCKPNARFPVPEKRRALVLGNANYKFSFALSNSKSDAIDMAST